MFVGIRVYKHVCIYLENLTRPLEHKAQEEFRPRAKSTYLMYDLYGFDRSYSLNVVNFQIKRVLTFCDSRVDCSDLCVLAVFIATCAMY